MSKYFSKKENKILNRLAWTYEDGRFDAVNLMVRKLNNICGKRRNDCELCPLALFHNDEFYACGIDEVADGIKGEYVR